MKPETKIGLILAAAALIVAVAAWLNPFSAVGPSPFWKKQSDYKITTEERSRNEPAAGSNRVTEASAGTLSQPATTQAAPANLPNAATVDASDSPSRVATPSTVQMEQTSFPSSSSGDLSQPLPLRITAAHDAAYDHKYPYVPTPYSATQRMPLLMVREQVDGCHLLKFCRLVFTNDDTCGVYQMVQGSWYGLPDEYCATQAWLVAADGAVFRYEFDGGAFEVFRLVDVLPPNHAGARAAQTFRTLRIHRWSDRIGIGGIAIEP